MINLTKSDDYGYSHGFFERMFLRELVEKERKRIIARLKHPMPAITRERMTRRLDVTTRATNYLTD